MLMLTLPLVSFVTLPLLISIQLNHTLVGMCFYAGCSVIWASKIQSLMAQSNTETQYMALFGQLCDVITIMQLIEKIAKYDFPVLCTDPYLYCKAFEDKLVVLKLAHLSKLCYINVHYHHFYEHIHNRKNQDLPACD